MGSKEYPETDRAPESVYADVDLPDDPAASEYPTAGDREAAVQVAYYGSWKCPVCARFDAEHLSEFLTNYVNRRDVRLTYRNLSYAGGDAFLGRDAPRTGTAGLSVWNNDPRSYWNFHGYVYANQPPEDERWGTVDNLMNFVENSGVERQEWIRAEVEDGAYRELLRRSDESAQKLGVAGTPAVVIENRIARNAMNYDSWTDEVDRMLSDG